MRNHHAGKEKNLDVTDYECHRMGKWTNLRTYRRGGNFADGKGCAWQSEVENMNSKGQSAATAGQNFHNIPLGLLAFLLFDKSCRNLSRGRFQWYRKPRLPPLYYWSCSIQGACCRCKSRPLLAWMPIQLASVFSHMAQASRCLLFNIPSLPRVHLAAPFHSWLPKIGLTKDALWTFIPRNL